MLTRQGHRGSSRFACGVHHWGRVFVTYGSAYVGNEAVYVKKSSSSKKTKRLRAIRCHSSIPFFAYVNRRLCSRGDLREVVTKRKLSKVDKTMFTNDDTNNQVDNIVIAVRVSKMTSV